MGSKEYWDKKIIEWERSCYQADKCKLSFIEKVATFFRSPIKKRREVLLRVIGNDLSNSVILELGCGSGDLSIEFLRRGAKKVFGIDIADSAIRSARNKAASLGFDQKVEFLVRDVREAGQLPEADLTAGLGFIDYIDLVSLKSLFARIKGRFIFSFPEKKINLINILHYLYLRLQRCPDFYKFRRADFREVPGMAGECYFFTLEKMTFIANFKPDAF
jgi:SAM-dependent methyltransferase